MRHLWQLISLLLLTTWLPATQFCNLASAGLIARHHRASRLPGGSAPIHGCELVKNSDPQFGAPKIKAAALELLAQSCSLWLPSLPLEVGWGDTALSVPPIEYHEDWVKTWHIVQRAALPARAPTWLGA
jgi:hypothetical protein